MREKNDLEMDGNEAGRLAHAASTQTKNRRRGMKPGEVIDYLLLVSHRAHPTFTSVRFEGRAMDLTWSDTSGLRATLRLSDAVRRRVTPGHLNLLIARADKLLRDAGRSRNGDLEPKDVGITI